MSPLVLLMALSRHQVSAGQALLDKMSAKFKAAQSVSLRATMTMMGQDIALQYSTLRGGYTHTTMSMPQMEEFTTPQGGWAVLAATRQFVRESAAEVKERQGVDQFFGFENQTALSAPDAAKLGGHDYLKVKLKWPNNDMFDAGSLYVDPQTDLPARIEATMHGSPIAVSYTDIKLDPGLTPKDFEWIPPAGWTEFKPSTQAPNYEANLLKLKSKAPAFKLSKPTGGTTTLAAQLKGAKAVLVNFWFYG